MTDSQLHQHAISKQTSAPYPTLGLFLEGRQSQVKVNHDLCYAEMPGEAIVFQVYMFTLKEKLPLFNVFVELW
ncbi:hypothetical protein CL176_06900 [Suicoccus acidiformans]|uniref:Uncharacterized protein n=1 Tax=Suicoccus acidiformans TaxID=2036206 RepID=A0A347WKZ1_9LACT|nr:hypothetical protein [Suicoccus acidiformans]AXY25748.1 hypothetical protein CL176_06900 [Suicoccus acidiformans]